MKRCLKIKNLSLKIKNLFRSELSQNIGQFAKSIAVLGSVEENMALSKALSALAEIETKVEQLTADQADADFFVLSELVKDYINLIQSVKVLSVGKIQRPVHWIHKGRGVIFNGGWLENMHCLRTYYSDPLACIIILPWIDLLFMTICRVCRIR